MIDDIRFQANWDRIKNNKQKYIEKSNKRENLNRIKHKYNVSRKPGIRRKLSLGDSPQMLACRDSPLMC
jgi:hypothetical protein